MVNIVDQIFDSSILRMASVLRTEGKLATPETVGATVAANLLPILVQRAAVLLREQAES
jgi:hypothetical protein